MIYPLQDKICNKLWIFSKGHKGVKDHVSLQIPKIRRFFRYQIQCYSVKYILFTLDAYIIYIKEGFEKKGT